MNSNSAALVSVEALEVAYGATRILHQVSASFPERQVTAIMGPSGCGKSTLLRVLNRTLELSPEARMIGGRVHFRGRNIYDRAMDIRTLRKQVGIVQQRPLAFPMSIQENVLFGRRHHGHVHRSERERTAGKVLERVGLWEEVKHRLHTPANRLSIGQLQRLCLARTLANDPEVILMDEPCSALDPESTGTIEALIRDLKATLTIIIVTHNVAQARRVSDHALFLLQGAVLEAGPTQQIMENPQHPRVRRIVLGEEG
jgi:phosphate transport system ATP-binding protein